MTRGFARTLYDYRTELQWVRLLGWSDDELRSVPVHEEATAGQDYLNLANFGGTGLGVTSRDAGGGTSANVRTGIRNLYVFKSEAPDVLWRRLSELASRGGPSAFEESGIFGERGEKSDFPPRG